MCGEEPVFPDDEGLELLPFTGECLTYEGEINKLAVNVAFGRYVVDYSCVHNETCERKELIFSFVDQ